MPRCPKGYKWNKLKSRCEHSVYADWTCPDGMIISKGKCIKNPFVKIEVLRPIEAVPNNPKFWAISKMLPKGTQFTVDERTLGSDFVETDILDRIHEAYLEVSRKDIFSKKVKWRN